MGLETWTDFLLNWLGVGGLIAYAVYIHGNRQRGGLEMMMLILLYTLAVLYISRSFYWLTDDFLLQVLSFIPATLIPLPITLFVEALMRRHVPLALKIFVVAGTLVCFVMNLVPDVNRRTLWIISIVVTLGTLAWLGLIALFRNRARHAPMENRLINGCAAALAFAFLLTATDVGLGPAWLHFRLGGIGALIFVYVCVRLTDPGESAAALFRELSAIAAIALGGLGAFALLVPGAEADLYVAIFVVLLASVLLYAIFGRLRAKRQPTFFRWLLDASTGSVDGFIDALHGLPLANDHRILRGADVDAYGPEIMAATFDDANAVWGIGRLRAELTNESRRDGAERLIGMLEQNHMTHVALLATRPHAFLLLTLPQLAGGHNPMLEIELIQKFARLLSAGPS